MNFFTMNPSLKQKKSFCLFIFFFFVCVGGGGGGEGW